MRRPEDKILPLAEALRLREEWAQKGQSLVFTNGCFDVLHAGHVHLLNSAKRMGDILLIGLNSDHSVKRLKGASRPINKEYDRALLLASMEAVDAVVLFKEDTPQNLIEKLLPDVLVKGGDYKEDEIVGAEMVRRHGGEVRIIPFREGYSSTAIIKKLK